MLRHDRYLNSNQKTFCTVDSCCSAPGVCIKRPLATSAVFCFIQRGEAARALVNPQHSHPHSHQPPPPPTHPPTDELAIPSSHLSVRQPTTNQSTPWRNGSASDSRSEGCVFKSRRGHNIFFFFSLMNLDIFCE